MIVALIGVLKASAAYIARPDTAAKAHRISDRQRGAQGSADARTFAGLAIPASCDLIDGAHTATADISNPSRVSAHTLAYVIFTSGTTGLPRASKSSILASSTTSGA